MTWQPLERSTPRKNGVEVKINGEEFWENDQYQVHVKTQTSDRDDVPDMKHLSICRQDKQAVHDWRHFQRIKNQLCGPEWEGVEIYPAETRLIDTANQYHLWCFQFTLGFGFQGRLLTNAAQTREAYPGSTQRDPEPVDTQYGGLSPMKELLRLLDEHKKTGYGDPITEEGA